MGEFDDGLSAALPVFGGEDSTLFEKTGLTKRELFAAMAMQGFCANPQYSELAYEIVANDSASQADALLKKLDQ